MKIFSEETIYHLGDRYVEYLKDYKKKQQDEYKHIAVFPSKLKIIPTVSIFHVYYSDQNLSSMQSESSV